MKGTIMLKKSTGSIEERRLALELARAALGAGLLFNHAQKTPAWKRALQRLWDGAEWLAYVLAAILILCVMVFVLPVALLLQKWVPAFKESCGSAFVFAVWTLIHRFTFRG